METHTSHRLESAILVAFAVWRPAELVVAASAALLLPVITVVDAAA